MRVYQGEKKKRKNKGSEEGEGRIISMKLPGIPKSAGNELR